VAYEFHLVGNGPLRGAIERQVREHGLAPRFRFHGGLPRSEVQRLLSRAHVAVLASVPTRNGKREGIPVALMEAMAAGVPVVASRLSGIPELVADQKSGLLVAPGDSNALADAIESLAHRPDLRVSMGAAGRADVMHDFDLQRNAGKLLGLIQSLPYQLTASPARHPISARLSIEQGNSI
jgi:colanic acid/amylovoran biosynthesis glycosyltransferase